MSPIAFSIWFVASLSYAYQYIIRVLPNILLLDITEIFNIDAALYGQFSGLYYIGYAAAHIPIGIMLDRYGPKKVMCICILLNVLGLLPLLYSDNWLLLIAGRILIGIGSAAAILGVFKVIRMLYRTELFGRMLGFSATIGLIGAIYGGAPVQYLHDVWGYKAVIEMIIVIGVVLAIITYFIMPEENEKEYGTVGSNIKEVLFNKNILLVCFFAGMLIGPMEGFADAWGTSFLIQVYGLSKHEAAYLPSMVFLGMGFAPLYAILLERVGKHLWVIMFSGILMTIIFILLILKLLPANSLIFTLGTVGLCSAYQIAVMYVVTTQVDKHVSGLATALANMIIMSFGYGFHTAIGLIVSYYGGATNPQALLYGMYVIPAMLILGVIGFLYLISSKLKVK